MLHARWDPTVYRSPAVVALRIAAAAPAATAMTDDQQADDVIVDIRPPDDPEPPHLSLIHI